jgi:hypothetical protein
LVAVDVSGSQIQIYAFLLGLRNLEKHLREASSYKKAAALRAWQRHDDPGDPFELPEGYDRTPLDKRLWATLKAVTMTSLYGSPPNKVIERLSDDPYEYGPGLGTTHNLKLFLDDDVLELN